MFNSALFNNYNKFQCRFSNFDEILFTPRLYKIARAIIFYTPGKVMHKIAEVIQLLRKLTLTRPVTVKVNKITSHVFHLFFSQLLYVVLYTRTLDYAFFVVTLEAAWRWARTTDTQ